MKKPRPKPKKATGLVKLQWALVTIGKAVRQLQRRVDRMERNDRIIRGFGSVECIGIPVEAEDEDDE